MTMTNPWTRPTTPKIRRRYKSEEHIVKLIDSALGRLAKISLTIEALWTKRATPDDNYKPTDTYNAIADEILRLEKRRERISKERLPRLKAKLAEMRTPQLPGVDNNDTTVPV